jgi:hypothetical protein
VTFFWIACWTAITLLALAARWARDRETLALAAPNAGTSSLSVVVAMRDEAPRIEALLDSLLAQDHPAFEVIVVDDRSTDDGAEVVRRRATGQARVRLIRVDRLPAGWQGRIFALGAGAEIARGEWLLFLSADQRLTRSDLLRSLVAYYERTPDGAVAAIGPFTGTRWWDRYWFRPLLDSPLVIGGVLLLQRLLPSSVWLVGALGMRRETYVALGGARAATGCGAGVFEDYGWAKVFAASGRPARTVWTPAMHDVSNWDTPLAAWQGLVRWIAGTLTYPPGGIWLAPFALAVTGLAAFGPLIAAWEWTSHGTVSAGALALAAIGPTIGLFYASADSRSAGVALLFPAIALVTFCVLLDGIRAWYVGEVRWRGDRLRLDAPVPPEVAGFADSGEARSCKDSPKTVNSD